MKNILLIFVTFFLVGCEDNKPTYESNSTSKMITKPMLSFQFNSNSKTQLTVAKPLFEKYGWKFSLAVDGKYLKDSDFNTYLTLEEIQGFQSCGYEIANHSKHHIPLQLNNERIPKGKTFQGAFIDGFVAYDEIYGAHVDMINNDLKPTSFMGSMSMVLPKYIRLHILNQLEKRQMK